jgi:apolipoprotein N-acyltransferase
MRSPYSNKVYFEIILVLISAILLILSFPHLNLEFLAWIAFVPLFFTLQNKSKNKAFLLSYLSGIMFWFGIIYWLIHVTFLGSVLLVLYLALYFGIFGFIITRYSLLSTRYSIIFVSSAWVLLEYLRSHLFTGFGWALLGYSQYLNLPAIQIADSTGVWGVSFLVMMVNVFVYNIIRYASCAMRKKQRKSLSLISCLLPLLFLFLSFGYGFYKLRTTHNTQHTALKISVIQGNVPQAIKWKKAAAGEILKRYFGLSRLVADDNPDLIIWPESALPGILGEDTHLTESLEALVNEIQIPLLLGVVSLDKNDYYNSSILISKQNKFIQRYDKIHLVPFGEYIPLKRIFGFLETIVPIGDFIPGKEYTVFSLDARRTTHDARRFSVLICFEDIFPQISRQFARRGADFLVNMTNDAWFGNTSSPYQHLSASVFRAVENGVYLVRAANTGISGFITSEGRIEPLIEHDSGKQTFISGYKTKDIFLKINQGSFYTQWGDWFILVCGMMAMYGFIMAKTSRLEV